MKKHIVMIFAMAVLGTALPAAAQRVVNCDSDHHERHFCQVDTQGGVVLLHQKSHAGCWQGDSWGYSRDGIWVANGCRATFRVGYSDNERQHSIHHNHRSDRDVDWNDRNSVRDWEQDHGSRHGERGRKVGKALGAALAIGILAAAADHANDHDNDDGYRGYGSRSVYKCESDRERYRYCSVSGRTHQVEIKRQLSRSSCRYGRDWGYDRRGIWVDHGCRAEFWVR